MSAQLAEADRALTGARVSDPMVAGNAEASAAEVARLRAELDRYRRWVARAADVCEKAARGDLEDRLLSIDVEGDLGRLLHAINDSFDVTDAFVRESRVSLSSACAGKFHREIVPNGLLGAFRQAAGAINDASREMARRSADLGQARRSRQELADGFEGFVEGMVSRVGTASALLAATAGSIVQKVDTARQQAEAVDGTSREVSTEVQSVARETERMIASATEISGQTRSSTDLCRTALDEASRGGEIVAALAQTSRRIGSVLKLIADIAHQTNLLALNATIEAARAGTAGRGFAVVASAVKGLARQTAGATEEIEREIGAMRAATTETVGAIERVTGAVRDLDGLAGSIAQGVEDQRRSTTSLGAGLTRASTRSQEVAGTIAEVCAATRSSSSSLASVLSAAHDVGQEVRSLQEEAARFLAEIRAA